MPLPHLNYPYQGTAEIMKKQLDEILIRATSPNETAAILLEPILGEGGVYQADKDFVTYLREVCDKHDILWISDEVQTGIGRTGKWWGYQHFNVEPDIITFGKGIASGFPLAGVVSNKTNYMNIQDNGLGGTYNGNVIATTAANATIDVINYENLITDSNGKGKYILNKLRNMKHPLIKEVRQYGLMIAIELDVTASEFKILMSKAEKYNLLLLSTGIIPTIPLLPPLTISKQEVDYFVEQLCKLLKV